MSLSPNGTCAALVSRKEGFTELQIAVLKCGNDGPAFLDSISTRCATVNTLNCSSRYARHLVLQDSSC